jgi:hypothetical protein
MVHVFYAVLLLLIVPLVARDPLVTVQSKEKVSTATLQQTPLKSNVLSPTKYIQSIKDILVKRGFPQEELVGFNKVSEISTEFLAKTVPQVHFDILNKVIQDVFKNYKAQLVEPKDGKAFLDTLLQAGDNVLQQYEMHVSKEKRL